MDLEYTKARKILVVDDETELLRMVCLILKQEGYTSIKTASTAEEALDIYRTWEPEFAILDVMLPDGDGFSLFSRMRELSDVPVLFLTARGEEEDKFRGLGLGADDYMVKPFLPKELTLRMGVIMRRCYKNTPMLVELAHCRIDFEQARVIRNGEHIQITAKEREVLLALCRNAGRIVTIEQLCEAAWGENPFGYENSLMVHIRRIREKIEEYPSQPESLLTVKGLGYKLLLKGM